MPDNPTPESGATAMVSSVAGFGEDLLNLAELQARLTAVELRQNLIVLKAGGTLIAGGLALAIAALPVGLMGLSELLVSEMGVKRGYAFLSVAAVALVIAAACWAGAALWLGRQRLGFPLCGEELARNLNWVRTVLRKSGRSPFRR